MKIDVFVRSFGPKIIRRQLFEACKTAWSMDSLANVNTNVTSISPDDYFHWRVRIYAESKAASNIYILSDDDVLPLGANWIERALAVAERNPEYAILTGNQVNHSARVKPQGREVQPCHMGGSPQLIRKGVIDWSQLSGPGKDEDEIVYLHCQKLGLQQGCMVDLDVNHIGQGFSVMNPEYWLRY